ncbi:hypothetical protein SDC9_172819 [bioreactor metagenome]|uniref:Uncharacterized protein n=1 Tax=bioreactor metagenome TaxID=1076179 RepID=A0A645GGY9_9ZZZZ
MLNMKQIFNVKTKEISQLTLLKSKFSVPKQQTYCTNFHSFERDYLPLDGDSLALTRGLIYS